MRRQRTDGCDHEGLLAALLDLGPITLGVVGQPPAPKAVVAAYTLVPLHGDPRPAEVDLILVDGPAALEGWAAANPALAVAWVAGEGIAEWRYDGASRGALPEVTNHHALICGLTALSRGILSPDGRGSGADAPPPAASPGLSAREGEVLALVVRGLSGPRIARHLGLSPWTVKTHLANLYAKLGAPNRAVAVALALRLGIVQPPAGGEAAGLHNPTG